MNNKGEIKQTIQNCVIAILGDEKLAGMFRYNEMTERIELTKSWWKRSSVSITDNDENNVRFYLESKYGLFSEKNIPRAIDIVAHQNSYHPVREFLNGLKWDGQNRIENLLSKYLGCDKSEYTVAAIKLFMFGAIARVFEPGMKFDVMVCLVEDRQGGGKSTVARFLAVKDEWYSDDIKSIDDENVFRKLQGHWIVEFSEMLATSNAKTVESIKSFLSRQKDTYKIPYDRYARDFPRQCVFVGTTNNIDFLPSDRTGNRRFIPVLAHSDQAEVHPMLNEQETRDYIVQCWAEAMDLYRRGEHFLTFPVELEHTLIEIQRDFEPEDPKVGIVQSWLDKCEYDSVCTMMIYREAFGNAYIEPKQWELREIAGILNKSIVGWKKHQTSDNKVRFKEYGKQRAWDRVPKEGRPQDGFVPLVDSPDYQLAVFE